MRPLAAALGQQPVLVVGRHEVAAVAASYGFSKVLTTRQLAAALGPGALPFLKHSAAAAGRQPDPGALESLIHKGALPWLTACCAGRSAPGMASAADASSAPA